MRHVEPSARARRPDAASLAVVYLSAQAALAALWWVLLLTVPAVRAPFEVADDDPAVLDAFLTADIIVFIGGSAAAAIAVHRGAPAAAALCWFLAGGVASATALLMALAVSLGAGVVGIVPMTAASIITVAIAATAATPARGDVVPIEHVTGPTA